MKIKKIFAFFFFVLIITSSYSQNDYSNDVHRYIISQAWEYLKHHKQSINWNNTHMTNHIGTEDPSGPDEPWAHPLVISGAAREDEEDPIYEYGWPNTTSTHFWNADEGDYWKLETFWHDYENAYQKARIYAFDEGHTIYIKHTEGNIYGKYYTMNMFTLFNTGQCVLNGYRTSSGVTWLTPQVVTLPIEQARGYAYIILGRIAHLLMDQTVPAHAHGDTHPISDYYEDWISSYYTLWDKNLIPLTGARNLGPTGIIDDNCTNNPLRYLFYVTNQVADIFPSDNEPGDQLYTPYLGDGSNHSIYIEPIYNQ